MSEYKERGVKRRDFRSAKDKPEVPGPTPKRRTYKPFIVLSRYKPEFFEKNKDSYWGISKEAKESNNQWHQYSRFSSAAGAQQAVAHWGKDVYWGKQYEFKILDTSVGKGETRARKAG